MKRCTAVLFVFALAIGGGAAAQEVSSRILEPDWLSRPSGKDIARVFPEQAQLQNLNGLAVMDCGVDARGLLVDCRIRYEAPIHSGFGAAALRLASIFRMAAVTRDGKPTAGGSVRLPIGFRLPGTDESFFAMYPGSPAYLLRPDPKGDLACPNAADPQRKCARHPLGWREGPDSRQVLDAAVGGPLRAPTFLTCKVQPGGELAGCAAPASAEVRAKTAMLSLAPLFRADAETSDGLPTAGGTVVMLFDWPRISSSLGAPTR